MMLIAVRTVAMSSVALMATFAGCSSPRPPPPPAHFDLAQKAKAEKNYAEAGKQFALFAKQALVRLNSGGDLKWIRNTSLAFRDAANNYQLAGDIDSAITNIETCVREMAVYADGLLCKNRGLAILSEAGASKERVQQYQTYVTQFDLVRDTQKAVIDSRIQARTAQADAERRAWEAGASQREREKERARLERDLDFAKASEQLLIASRKDASDIRIRRQSLERQLAELDARHAREAATEAGSGPQTVVQTSQPQSSALPSNTRPDVTVSAGTVTQVPQCVVVNVKSSSDFRGKRTKVDVRNACSMAVVAVGCIDFPALRADPQFSCTNGKPLVGAMDRGKLILAAGYEREWDLPGDIDGSPIRLSKYSFVVCPAGVGGKAVKIDPIRFAADTYTGTCRVTNEQAWWERK